MLGAHNGEIVSLSIVLLVNAYLITSSVNVFLKILL